MLEGAITFKESPYSEIDTIAEVHELAFGSEIEPNLVRDLMQDASAEPILSLLAVSGGKAIGHILFTKVRLEPVGNSALTGNCLAPLAVIPEVQSRGVGGKLIKEGLRILKSKGVSLVFVLGYPSYYSRFGFSPAGALGYNAPYPIEEKNADAWMVQSLDTDPLNSDPRTVICADSLMRPEYWVE